MQVYRYRWTARRKAAVIDQISSGALSAAEACGLYDLSAEELESWRLTFVSHGVPGLRVKALRWRG